MAAFDQIRLSHLKMYLLCNLLILKRIKFAKQRRKRICWIRKIRSSRSFQCRCSWKFHKFHRKISVLESLFLMTLLVLNFIKRNSNRGVFVWNLRDFQEYFFLQNTHRGYFWKIYLDSPKKGGYILLVIYTGMQLFYRGYFFSRFRMSPAVCEEL